MKRFIFVALLSLLSLSEKACAQYHIIPLNAVNIDSNANWNTKVAGYINLGNTGGNIDLSGTGGYLHTLDSGGSITTSHHGGYIATSYGGGAISTTGTGGGIYTLNFGGDIDTSNHGAGIKTNSYSPALGDVFAYDGSRMVPTSYPPTALVASASTQVFTSGVTTKVIFAAVAKDTRGWWDGTNNRFTPLSGYYQLVFALVSDGVTKQVTINKNGSIFKYLTLSTADTSVDTSWTVIASGNGTDYFEVFITAIGANSSVYSGSPGTYFAIIPLR